ncbi:helix-turn-helix transcriptional regulator [Brachybacterium tyrofermentans]|uniref:helix-turn-helix transcriptional regulator n=1 Tax=Brachybacterium tyrofermentans TaxID=47848 RepID=UPI003FD60FB9
MTSSKLLTSSEVAERLGISRQTVAWRVARGQLAPAQQLPGRSGAYLFDADQIAALAADHAAALTAEAARLTTEATR